MDRRKASSAVAFAAMGLSQTYANPLLLFRFLFGTGARVGASAVVRSLATTAVERTILVNGARTVIRTVATREIGLSLSGVAFISLAAAEAIEKYDCKNVCVIGSNKGITCTPTMQPTQSMNFLVSLYNTASGVQEWERPAYITPKEFRFSIDFPLHVRNGVKHLVATSPQGAFESIQSTNFYLAHPLELFEK